MNGNIDPNASAIKKFGINYYLSAQEEIKNRANNDGNKDGKYSVEEFTESFFSKTESPYYQSSSYKEQADALVNSNKELFEFYAGEDGELNATEYCNLINSEEYIDFIDNWKYLNDAHSGTASFLGNVDNFQSNYADGEVTPEEYFNYQLELYKLVFEGDSEKIQMATKLAISDYNDMKAFAGDDNVISIDESIAHLNSDSYSKILDQYWAMRDDYDSKHAE